MNGRAGLLTGGGLAALGVFLATNGQGLFEGLKAGWLFLQLVTADMPLGLGAAVLVLVLGVLSQAVLRRWLPHTSDYAKHWRTFLVEASALVLCVLVMWLITDASKPDAKMMALLLGTVDGLAAPFVYRLLAATWCAAKNVPSEPPGAG